jgi:hypothetical protein
MEAALDFPEDQSCCGLPAVMMGEKHAAREVARQKILAFQNGGFDSIVTLRASCASHLKNGFSRPKHSEKLIDWKHGLFFPPDPGADATIVGIDICDKHANQPCAWP